MPIQLLQTKLHKPPIPGNYLHRQRLKDKISQHGHVPFTLVSAPAGYGKSTLISSWLESCEIQSAWVSLDEQDNDLNVFLSYLLAAVQSLFPDACYETSAMLKAAESPSVSLLARNLINELDCINESFIIVLDDYHVIKDKDLHYLLAELLKYPPKPLHLVVISRRDPLLPIAKIRAKNQMKEIRANDLRFSNEESSAFLEKCLGVSLDMKTVAVVEKKTEGWITGLRLTALTLRNQPDRDHFLKNLPEDNRYVLDYILSEVLSEYSPVMREYLISVSILNRFSASLCDAVCTHSNTPNNEKMTGQEYIARLEQDNLFVIPLDDEQEWFRHHHLIQTLLQRLLKLRSNQDDINVLHKRASEWFAENGLIEEALHHALDGGDTAFAAQLIAQNRYDLLNQEQWARFRRWLNLLPHDCIDENPELLICQAWLLCNSMHYLEMSDKLDQIEVFLASRQNESAKDTILMGEINVLRGIQLYLGSPCDGPSALAHAQKALQRIPTHLPVARGLALLVMAMSYQMTGDLSRAYSVVFDVIKDMQDSHPVMYTRLLVSLCHMNWIDADLRTHKQTAEQLMKISNEKDLTESEAHARYFLGVNHYCHNELLEAESYLAAVVYDTKIAHVFNFVQCVFILALTYQAQGRQAEAWKVTELVTRHAIENMNKSLLELAQAFQAELSLRQGNVAEAGQWATTYHPEPFSTTINLYAPQLTMAKWLLSRRSKESLIKADDLLSRLHDFYISIHNRTFVMRVLLLQSLLHDFQGREKAAFEKLTESISLAEPSRFIRPFLDLGQPMFDLLNRFGKRKSDIKYTGKLLSAFRNERGSAVLADGPIHRTGITAPGKSSDAKEALSKRELEVLSLVVQRLSNKEIAEKLFISPGTVKQHIYKIFQKLNVSKRHEAAEKATSLGVI